MPSPNHASYYRPDVDGLRAIAVLSVIGYHGSWRLVPGGFIGVDVFFVISGYLISSIIFRGLDSGTFSFFGFYGRRIRRIFPALIIVLAATCATGWFVLLPEEYKNLGRHVTASAVFLSNFLLWQQAGYFDTAAADLKPLLHLWSLGIEEQFYIIWPLLLYQCWKRKCSAFTLLGLITLLSFAGNVSLIGDHARATFYLPYGRVWELSLGGMLAHLEIYRGSRSAGMLERPFFRALLSLGSPALHANARAWIGLLMILSSIVVIDRTTAFPGWWALLPTLGAFLCISAGSGAWVNRRLLANRTLVFVGLISFPLYLWHWPLLSFVRIVEFGNQTREMKIAAVALAFPLAWLTYQFIEKPVRFSGLNSVTGRVLVPVALAMLVASVGLFGLAAEKHDGLTSRVKIAEFAAKSGYLEQLEQLKFETPSNADCDAYVGARRSFDFCRITQGKDLPTIAIVGDSHAYALFPGFSEHFARSGRRVILLGASGCPPHLATTAYAEGTKTTKLACTSRVDEIFAILAARNEIKHVILASRGSLYITGTGFGAIARSNPRILIESLDNRDGDKNSTDTFSSGLGNSIAALTRAGKMVSYVLQVPELGFYPGDCMERPVRLSRTRVCAVGADVVRARQASYRDAVYSLQSGNSFDIFDPLPLFCGPADCRAIINGRLLYADDNHLSVEGSRLVASRFAPLLSME